MTEDVKVEAVEAVDEMVRVAFIDEWSGILLRYDTYSEKELLRQPVHVTNPEEGLEPGKWQWEVNSKAFVRVKVRAARIDKERGVFMGMDELLPEELTEFHLPQITQCDLEPGSARWDAKAGTFVVLPKEQRAKLAVPTLEVAFAFTLLAAYQREMIPEVTCLWLDALMSTVDMQPYLTVPLVQRYRLDRGLAKE